MDLHAFLVKSWPYRRSKSRWVGGEHKIEAKVGDQPHAEGWSEEVWHRKHRWRGANSHARVTITPRAIAALGDQLIVGGLLTLDAEQVGPREYRAVWAEQGRGFGLRLVHGWIIRGRHSTRASLASARKEVAKARAAAAARLWRGRVRFAVPASSTWVTVADSLAAGNCMPATMAVRDRVRAELGQEVEAVRGDVLLRLVHTTERAGALRAIALASRRAAAAPEPAAL